MNYNSLFSIIVPVYNADKYLDQMIQSVLSQSYTNWELILIDDGSNDNSLEICTNYCKNDNRIKVFHKKNTGVSDSRNIGINKSLGKWIVFLDADDWLEYDFLQSFYQSYMENESDLIIANFYWSKNSRKTSDREITERSIDLDKKNNFVETIVAWNGYKGERWYGNLRVVWGKCFIRDIILENKIYFKKDIKIGEDMVFLLSYVINSRKISFINKPLVNYRYNENSATHSNKWKGFKNGNLYYDFVFELTRDLNISDSAKGILWLETVENSWFSLLKEPIRIKEKEKIFYDCITSERAILFSNSISKQDSIKKRIYAFCIKKKNAKIFIMCLYFFDIFR